MARFTQFRNREVGFKNVKISALQRLSGTLNLCYVFRINSKWTVRIVLNLGFCKGQIIYENKEVMWRTRFGEGEKMGSSFHSIYIHIYKQIKVSMIIIQYSYRWSTG